jgi:hypothetical protein
MGDVVAEALRLAGTTQLVDTYVAMQGTLPSHAYDPSAPTRQPKAAGLNLGSSRLRYQPVRLPNSEVTC